MKSTQLIRIITLLVVTALPAARVAAQQADAASIQRARAGLPPAQATAFDEILNRARARGLPTAPLVDKALEGAAKGVPADRVIAVLRLGADRLGTAQDIVGARAEADIANAALALDRGVNEKAARQLAVGARKGEPLGMALNVLADLLERGVPVDIALGVLTSWRDHGAKSSDLQDLPAAVERLVRSGARPDRAAQEVEESIRSGRGASSVLPGVNPQGKSTGPKADRPPVAPQTGPPAGKKKKTELI